MYYSAGFGFFILIAVSAYVANLAAFLTLSSVGSVSSMEGAVAAGFSICAHPALKAEMQTAWPDAKFIFHEEGNDFHGLLDDYDAGKCRLMAVGMEDTSYDTSYLERLCERDLVYTDSHVIELPIGFPIRRELAAGFSYWILEGEKNQGTSIQTVKEEFAPQVSCAVKFSGQATEGSDTDEIGVKNLFFPLIFFSCCAVIGILLHIIHQRNAKMGRKSLVGRRSSLELMGDVDDSGQPKLTSSITAMLRRISADDEHKEDDDFLESGSRDAFSRKLNGDDGGVGVGQRISARSLMAGDIHSNEDNVERPRSLKVSFSQEVVQSYEG